MRGRKPTPRNLRLVTGADGRLAAEQQPEPAVSVPPAPDFLEGDEITCFNTTAEKLALMRVMTDADVDGLAVYAVNFTRWIEATAKVRESGLVVRSPNDHPIQNPYLSIANRAQHECLRILSEFGLTPSSRTRVRKN